MRMSSTLTSPRESHAKRSPSSGEVRILGHISRPAYGEGRQTPQRQMLFVNGRPCGLPQVTKAFNEAHKSYNVTHSPFILANLSMDTSKSRASKSFITTSVSG